MPQIVPLQQTIMPQASIRAYAQAAWLCRKGDSPLSFFQARNGRRADCRWRIRRPRISCMHRRRHRTREIFSPFAASVTRNCVPCQLIESLHHRPDIHNGQTSSLTGILVSRLLCSLSYSVAESRFCSDWLKEWGLMRISRSTT